MTFETASNVTSLGGLMRYSNMVTDGLFGVIMLITIFIVAFIAMRQANVEQRGSLARIFSASAFITMVFSVIFFIIGIVNDVTMIVCIIAVAVSVFANVNSGYD